MVHDVCGVRSPSFQSSSASYITSMNNTSLQEQVIQGLEEGSEYSMLPM